MKRAAIIAGILILAFPLVLRFRGLDRGHIEDGRYVNRYLQLSFEVPEGWTPLPSEQMLKRARAAWLKTEGVDPGERIENKYSKLLFEILEAPPGEQQRIRGSLSGEARKIGYPGGTPSVRHHLERMKVLMDRGTLDYRIVEDIADARFGNVSGLRLVSKVYSGRTTSSGEPEAAVRDFYAFKVRGYSVLIFATYGDDEETAALRAIDSLRVR